MNVSGAQPPLRQSEVGASHLGVDKGGIGCQDIGTYLFGGGTISPSIRVIVMGPDTAYAEGVGRIPP